MVKKENLVWIAFILFIILLIGYYYFKQKISTHNKTLILRQTQNCLVEKDELTNLVTSILKILDSINPRDYRDTMYAVDDLNGWLNRSFIGYTYISPTTIKTIVDGRFHIESIDEDDYEDVLDRLEMAHPYFRSAYNLLQTECNY